MYIYICISFVVDFPNFGPDTDLHKEHSANPTNITTSNTCDCLWWYPIAYLPKFSIWQTKQALPSTHNLSPFYWASRCPTQNTCAGCEYWLAYIWEGLNCTCLGSICGVCGTATADCHCFERVSISAVGIMSLATCTYRAGWLICWIRKWRSHSVGNRPCTTCLSYTTTYLAGSTVR